MEAPVSKKPVKKPRVRFSQETLKFLKLVSAAPITTANPIIKQFGGRIKRTNPPALSIYAQTLRGMHNEFIKQRYKIHV
jgi:hypothetical protein